MGPFRPANEDIERMARRLAKGRARLRYAIALAKANHNATPCAGTPIPWEEKPAVWKRSYIREAVVYLASLQEESKK